MKNKKILAILALTVTLSGAMTACSFGGNNGDDQVVVETTPTPEPTKAPQPTPTPVPQDLTYKSADKTVSIKLIDATWARKTDEAGMLSFESPDQGKILILHGAGAEDMETALIPSTQDMAVTLEKADNLEEGTDFEIQDYSANDVNGIGVYSYTVKYANKEKSGGYAYVVHKVIANDNEFYNLAGSVKGDSADALSKMKTCIESFKITGDSALKSAASGQDANANNGGDANGGANQGGEGNSSGQAQGTPSDDALSDTNQTRTIYRNSDGQALVITADGNGNWVDDNGNTYDFATDEDVYDQDGVDYYYHGEAADVYYMPVGGGSDDYDDESYDESYDENYDDSEDYE